MRGELGTQKEQGGMRERSAEDEIAGNCYRKKKLKGSTFSEKTQIFQETPRVYRETQHRRLSCDAKYVRRRDKLFIISETKYYESSSKKNQYNK